MKYGFEEISQGVRLNDSMSEIYDSLPGVAESMGVDVDALFQVMEARREMVMQSGVISEIAVSLLTGERSDPAHIVAALIGAAWADGFFTALHMAEQADKAKLDTSP